MADNGIFEEMVDQAMERVASDSKKATSRDITLVAYGMITRNFSEKIDNLSETLRKPLYFVAGAIGVVGIAFILETILTRIF